MTSARSPFATPAERLATYFDCAQPRDTFGDGDIDEIATLLEQCGHIASKCPRTYILFRTIGQLEIVERLVNAGFSDQFFPVEARNLPTFLDLKVIQAVVKQQCIILTKSLDLENGRHRHFTPGETLPFEILGRLGSGAYGQVDRILSRTSFKQYALKRIRRRAAFGNISSREAVRGFLNEMKILRSLQHRHIVRYVGSYTDKSYLGLVMSPVADTDLASYNTRLCGFLQAIQADKSSFYSQDQPVTTEMSSTLRTFYGCLTAALRHLHEQSIRHKDIKPQNILVAKSNVLLTDFGLSRDFADDVGSTTSGVTPASARYCAPEVASYEARNTSSDIWSLGCVFLEMTAALQGLNVEWIKQFFLQSGSEGTHFHNNPAATARLIEKLKSGGGSRDQRTLAWIEQMVIPHRGTRFTAAQVIELITSPETSEVDAMPNMFCGICCVPDLESDSLDSLADDLDVVTTISPPGQNFRRRNSSQHHQANDPQSDAHETVTLKAQDENVISDTQNPKAAPLLILTSYKVPVNRPRSPPWHQPPSRSLPAGSPQRRLKENKLEATPVSTPPILADTNTNVDLEPFLETETSSDEDTIFDASTPSLSGRSSQHGDNLGAEMFPEREVLKDESRVDVRDDLNGRLRRVFGESILVSIEYAFHQLDSLKTVGGAAISGRIPTVIFSCGDLIQSSTNKDNLLFRHFPPPSGDELDLFHKMPWLPDKFDVDYDRNGYIKPLRWHDCGVILHAYLSTLPKPIIPPRNMKRILQILWNSDSREEKRKWLQVTLLQMRPPYCLTVLYLLNLCASCAELYPKDKDAIVEAYYPSFFGPNIASIEIEQWEKKAVLKFMIDHAEYLLGGPIEGETISEDNELLLQKLRGDQASSASVDHRITSSMNQVQFAPSIPTPEIKRHKASSGDSKPPTKRAQEIAELLKEGITSAQIQKYSSSIDTYVSASRSLYIMELPLWITTRFAGVARSTFDDLKNGVDIYCTVPIIIAECCTRIISQCGPKDSNTYNNILGYNNWDIFRISSQLERPGDIDRTASLLTLFTHGPKYGRGLIRPENNTRSLGAALFTYLSALPEPIIPYHIARRMMDLRPPSQSTQSSQSTVVSDLQSYISRLAGPNRETLIYLLLFLNRITHRTDEISRLFGSIIIGYSAHRSPQSAAIVDSMIRHVSAIVRPTRDAKVVVNPEQPEHGTPQAPSLHATSSSPQDLVVARFRHNAKGDLSFSPDEIIRVISRTGYVDGYWLGEVRGETGYFPGIATRPYDPERPSNQTIRPKPDSPFAKPTGEQVARKREVTPPEPKRGFRNTLHSLFERGEKE